MLIIVDKLQLLDWAALMEVYSEGNLENAQSPDSGGLLGVERSFYTYLQEVFFAAPGAFYGVWQESGQYVSALRMEPYQDGWLLEALETAPAHRRRGYAKALIQAVLARMKQDGDTVVYSHVSKKNAASLAVHAACGFEKHLDHAVYIDGTVTQSACTLRICCSACY